MLDTRNQCCSFGMDYRDASSTFSLAPSPRRDVLNFRVSRSVYVEHGDVNSLSWNFSFGINRWINDAVQHINLRRSWFPSGTIVVNRYDLFPGYLGEKWLPIMFLIPVSSRYRICIIHRSLDLFSPQHNDLLSPRSRDTLMPLQLPT